jgi:hypothetical protein
MASAAATRGAHQSIKRHHRSFRQAFDWLSTTVTVVKGQSENRGKIQSARQKL